MDGRNASIAVPGLHSLDERDAMMERQPWFIEFEPPAQVAGGATATVDITVPWRDFVCTYIGMTAETVGFPATPGRFKVSVEDIGAQRTWQPAAFDITPFVGNMGINDAGAFQLSAPWLFLEKTQIRVQMQNRDPAIPCLPTLVLHGFLTNWEREANSAMRKQQLELNALKIAAGEEPGDHQERPGYTTGRPGGR